MMMNKQQLVELLKPIENSPTECDGFVRLASFHLTQQSIPHTICHGSLKLKSEAKTIPFHFWIEAEDYIIDYRARMWIGENAPHGVFKKDDSFTYTGQAVKMNPASELLYKILMMG